MSVEKEAPKSSEKKVKPPKEKKEPKKEVEEAPVDVGRLDMRVGHIRKATKHPDADALYVEEVEILAPPPGSKPGDVVCVEGFTRNPDAQLNPKKKIFEACAPDLKVNSSKEATYKGVKWSVNGQPVTSQSLIEVQVK